MKQFEFDTDHFLILRNLIRPFIIFDKVGCINLESAEKLASQSHSMRHNKHIDSRPQQNSVRLRHNTRHAATAPN
jgi:hypothetical protein